MTVAVLRASKTRSLCWTLATLLLGAGCAEDGATPDLGDTGSEGNPAAVSDASAGGSLPDGGQGDSAVPRLDASSPDAGVASDAAAVAPGAEASAALDSGGSGNPVADAGSDAGGAPTAACDRACLLGFVSDYLVALVAKDPAKLKLSANLKYTDNGVVAKLGDGLWKTASALVEGARLDFADPQEGQVASQLVVNENGTSPVIYQVRLKVVNREISEIEALTVRRQGARNGFFTPANMKPQPVFNQAIDPALRMTRAELKAEVDLYLDYLDGKIAGSALHLDEKCARYENGVRTANGLGSFETQRWSFHTGRRYLIFDEEAGIAWGMFPFEQTATALVVGEAFKVMGKKIMMIQAVMADIPAKAWD